MKCLFYFKEKRQKRGEKSAPIFNNDSKSDMSGTPADRMAMSTSSASGATASSRTFSELYEEKSHNLRVFKYRELIEATDNFSRQLKIGEGGFGSVYKGSIKVDDGGGYSSVAVKKLNKDGFQGHKQWVAEVQFLGILEHPNLVKLIGYCAVDAERGIQRLLVYEFMPNKSLEDHLFNRAYPALPWETRLQIALGAAQGVAFLHEESEIQVIYRDFKTSNVLLDNDFKPKISDFGLAREGPTGGHTHVSTAAVGTFGYAAPDYIETGHLTSKSDVWSFGVVLYEMLTGRRSLERSKPRSEQKLLDWVKDYPAHSRKFSRIVDPRLENRYSLSAARAVAKLADSCLVKSARDRPKMSQVVETLKQIMSLTDKDTPSDQSIERSEVSDSGEGDDDPTVEKMPKDFGESESSKRRMSHLAKLSEHLGGVNRKGLMILHRAAANVV